MPGHGLGIGLIQPRGGIIAPPAATGLALWLDGRQGVLSAVAPDAVAVDGNTVRRWVNQSNPGTFDANQTTGNQQPLFEQAGRIAFDGTNDFVTGSLAGVGKTFCIALRVHQVGGRLAGGLFSMSKTDNPFDGAQEGFSLSRYYNQLWIETNNQSLYTIGSVFPNTDVAETGPFNIVVNSTDAACNFYVGGTLRLAGAVINNPFAPNQYHLSVRWAYGLVNHAANKYDRVVIYNNALTTDQLSELNSWLVA